MQVNQPKVSAAKASTAAAHNERALFEAWVRREWPSAPLHRVRDALPVNDPRYGEYCNEILQRVWVGWQARASLAQPSAAPDLKCPKVVGYACLDDIQWGGDITLRPEKSEHYSVPFAPVVWTGQVPEGWKLVPEDATTEMVEALKARMTVTNRGTVLNAGHALNAAIAAAPAQGDE